MSRNTILFILLLAILSALAGFGAYRLVLNSDCVEERPIIQCT